MCQSSALPGYTWVSAEDATDFLPGWTCVRVDKPLPGSSANAWYLMWKIVRLITA